MRVANGSWVFRPGAQESSRRCEQDLRPKPRLISACKTEHPRGSSCQPRRGKQGARISHVMPRSNGLAKLTIDIQRAGPSNLAPKIGSLAARIHAPGTVPTPTGPRADTRTKRHAESRQNALLQVAQNPLVAQANFVGNTQNSNTGTRRGRQGGLQVAGSAAGAAPRHPQQPNVPLSIRGLAGPQVVEVKNLAPGTTAADVEEAMRRQGITIHSCRLLQTSPTVIADVVCVSKDDADKIAKFDGQWVRLHNPQFPATRFPKHHVVVTNEDWQVDDGYQLRVGEPRAAPDHLFRKDVPQINAIFVDGSMGFEPMATEDSNSGALYSDKLISPTRAHIQNSSRRGGRGFRGGRGGNTR